MSLEHENGIGLGMSAGGKAELPSLNVIVLTDAGGNEIVRLDSSDLFKIYTAWLALLDAWIERDRRADDDPG